MKRVFYLILVALFCVACGEPHIGALPEDIHLYGENVEVKVSVLTFDKFLRPYSKGKMAYKTQTITELLDGSVHNFTRHSMFFEEDSTECVEKGTFHIYTHSINDTIYSVGQAYPCFLAMKGFSVYVNDEPFECKVGNTVTIDGKVYTVKDILRIASRQNTGIYMLTGKTYYELLGETTVRNLGLQPNNVQKITISFD